MCNTNMIPISEINRKETVLLLSLFCKHTKSLNYYNITYIKNYF